MSDYWHKKFSEHVGHHIVCASYGDLENPDDICLECEDCGCVLVSAEDQDEYVIYDDEMLIDTIASFLEREDNWIDLKDSWRINDRSEALRNLLREALNERF